MGVPREKPLGARRRTNNNKLNLCMNLGPHCWRRGGGGGGGREKSLTTMPFLPPQRASKVRASGHDPRKGQVNVYN